MANLRAKQPGECLRQYAGPSTLLVPALFFLHTTDPSARAAVVNWAKDKLMPGGKAQVSALISEEM